MNPFKQTKKQLSIFITAGYPELNSTTTQLLQLQATGVDFIELGIPFSDPMADGPTIQHSSNQALKNGMNLHLLFEQLLSIKDQLTIPIVLMGYFNPILKFGLELFISKCKECNIKGLIIPDLSIEISESHFSEFNSSIPFIHLITPATEDERIIKIANASKNSFIYLVSSSTITGNSAQLDVNLPRYTEIKKMVKDVPLFMGFGIKTKEDVLAVQQITNGAIIGSEYLRQLNNGSEVAYIQSLMQ